MNNFDNRIIQIAANKRNNKLNDTDYLDLIPYIAQKSTTINDDYAKALIILISSLFRKVIIESGFNKKETQALITKFRDAGRRSAPWKPTSSIVPGRPQDGKDGNRISRWLLPSDHKFYATEVLATLVEIKYYLQTLSMQDSPNVSKYGFSSLFTPWLLEHNIEPGEYYDPVQLNPINFNDFIKDPKGIQSGHIIPLDRGGTHHPDNTFLMLFRSNQIQGNLTIQELLQFMRGTIKKHDEALQSKSILENKIRHS